MPRYPDKGVCPVQKSRLAAALAAGALAPALVIAPAAEAHPWPRSVQKAFVSSCVKSGGKRSVCVKAMRCVKRKVTVTQLAQVDSNARVKKKVNAIATQCTRQAIG